MHEFAEARKAIEAMIRSDDLPGLLRQTEYLHGHLCPYVSLGVKAGHYAMKTLERENIGMEEIIAIVECNNCFTDGIQVVTGCTFGNNSLIFKDLGKTAVTVARREDGQAVRLALRPDYTEQMLSRYPAAGPLFQKVIVDRQGSPEEIHRFQHLWPAISKKELEVPLEEQFTIRRLSLTLPAYAPIFASQVCSVCGEAVMETRVRLRQGKPLCLTCAGEDYFILTGHGMTITRDSDHD
ncbi:MAG: TraR/DksA C4-type zinc finger protein [Deltaproteobacteria bacterium]|nr:TraR/DksA C4-type zinc finger protein [Deltaproteobacteria bacterium]